MAAGKRAVTPPFRSLLFEQAGKCRHSAVNNFLSLLPQEVTWQVINLAEVGLRAYERSLRDLVSGVPHLV